MVENIAETTHNNKQSINQSINPISHDPRCYTCACNWHLLQSCYVHFITPTITLIWDFSQHLSIGIHRYTRKIRMRASFHLTILTPTSCFGHSYWNSCFIHRKFNIPWTAGAKHHVIGSSVQFRRASAVSIESSKLFLWFDTVFFGFF